MLKIWNKLLGVKHAIKHLHKQEFLHVTQRIEESRELLDQVQTLELTDHANVLLQEQEKQYTMALRKWLKVEESALTPRIRPFERK